MGAGFGFPVRRLGECPGPDHSLAHISGLGWGPTELRTPGSGGLHWAAGGALLEASLLVGAGGGGADSELAAFVPPLPCLQGRASGPAQPHVESTREQAPQTCCPPHPSQGFCFTGSTPLAFLQSPPLKPHGPRQDMKLQGLALALLGFLHPRSCRCAPVSSIRSRQRGHLPCLSPLRLL